MCASQKKSAILGVGAALPEKVVTNADLERLVDTTDEWITERTGIKERRIAEKHQHLTDFCEIAARQAIEDAGLNPADIDMIILGTATPDYLFPASAAILADRLGIKNKPAFDVTAACSGFLYSLTIADQFVKNGSVKYALVLGGEVLSKIVDWEDRSTCVLFGDGAGAVVLGQSDDPERGILSWTLSSDGATRSSLYMPAGGSVMPTCAQTVEQRLHYVKMEGNEVFRIAVRALMDMAVSAVEKAGLEPSQIDLFIPHQANLRIIEAVRKRMDIPPEKVFVNVNKYGNTSAASIPIALKEALLEGRLKKGDLVLFDSFGAGASAAAVCLRW